MKNSSICRPAAKMVLSFFAWCIFVCPVWALELASDTEIVSCGKETKQQKMAVKLLEKTLSEMFGTPVTVVQENQRKKTGPAIWLGNGRKAAENGVNAKELDPEQLIVKALPDGSVLLAGGARGIYYAAAEFLEAAGCRYYAKKARLIPKQSKIVLPDNLSVSRKPFFRRRGVYIGGESTDFYQWNKQNYEWLTPCLLEPCLGGAHSFNKLSSKFPEQVFALNEKGKRVRGPAGQLCLSSPEARKLMKESLRAVIEKNRKDSKAAGLPPARFFSVTQNDNSLCCQCKECRALAEKYGSESGLLLDFINDVASEFPQMTFVTAAYRTTRLPPKKGTVKAAPNVVISITPQGREWGTGEARFLLLPLTDERNSHVRRLYEDWLPFGDRFSTWDYAKLYQQRSPAPYTALPAILGNLPYYASRHIQVSYFQENEFGSRTGGTLDTHAFQELEVYANVKLQDDPFQDIQKLLQDYFTGYYGPAAKEMRQYLDYLVKRQNADPPEERAYFATWKYLDADFFRTSSALLEKALLQVKDRPDLTKRVLFEVVPLYSAWLVMWPYFERRNEKFAMPQEQILERLKSASAAVSERYYPNSVPYESRRLAALSGAKVILPPEIGSRPYRILFPMNGMSKDADSCIGASRKLGTRYNHSRKPEFGIYLPATRKGVMRKILASVPQDEKFHLFKIGSAPIPAELPYIYAHWSWKLTYRIGGIYTPDLAEQPVDLWVSAKFQGPAYVKGSTKKNLFAVDYFLFVPRK